MRTLFFIILCLLTLHLFSQEKQLEQAIGWNGNAIELHTISDNAKQQCGLLTANEDSIGVNWINSLKMPPPGEALFMINGGYYYAYYDKNGRKAMIFQL